MLIRVQKYIQKIGFILLILCASKMALNAQEMKCSNPIKLKVGANFPRVLGENSNGIFLIEDFSKAWLTVEVKSQK